MSDRLWQRLGAACGIVYVVLLIGGGSFEGNTVGIAFFVVILAFLFFLFFLGNLWSALRRAEGGSGWLSATARGDPVGRPSKMARLDCGSIRPGVHRRWDVRERRPPLRVGGTSDDPVYVVGHRDERRPDPACGSTSPG